MQAAAVPPAPPPRRRVYTAVDPRCEWASTEDADTLVVDVSGFRKEEMKVLYSTNQKLKVTGERQVDGAQWARFLKVFPVPRSCDAGAIRANMDTENTLLYVILPKGPPPSSKQKEHQPGISEKIPGSADGSSKQKEHQPGSSKSLRGQQKIPGSADGSSGSSSGSLWSAQEDAGKDKVEEKEQRDQGMEEQGQEAAMATQDLPRSDGDENAVERDDGEGKRWWRKIRVLHVLGFALVLALVGAGATVLYVMLL
ncbi:inactive protein RESTRICTED TEV MOVEMENT 2-like [Phragmites australis]|uniref:inactive protein RESTRICTED TEV MOVEMENT 2-like n=1 Tax=Phragmites australis TaxID=29695 RepID=UPI002D798EE5|nr:inactive protein RESTRICTED TEV MOVEMENT 2-like [Phragmites australis]